MQHKVEQVDRDWLPGDIWFSIPAYLHKSIESYAASHRLAAEAAAYERAARVAETNGIYHPLPADIAVKLSLAEHMRMAIAAAIRKFALSPVPAITVLGDSILHSDGRHEVVRYAADGSICERTIDGQSSPASGDGAGEVSERYLSSRFDWAAPGDQQEDAWLVRFCDKDCGEAIFTGPEAESDAWAHWNRYAPAYNIYVFRLARLAGQQGEKP